MIYKTSLDNLAKIVTVAVTLLFAFIIFGQFAFITDQGIAVPIYTTVLVLSIYVLTFVFSPINYEVLNECVIIHRPISNVTIYRNQIMSATIITKKEIGWVLRVFGVGGLFGYYGKFTNFKMGSMMWYTTRRDNLVLIKTSNGKKIIISPDEPEKFVADLMKGINGLGI